MHATLVLRNGRIRTFDPDKPFATAVAFRRDEIVAVGDTHDVDEFVGPGTQIVDLNGRTVVPGINDAHLHLYLFAQTRMKSRVDLHGATTIADISSALVGAAKAVDDHGWIVGGSWNHVRIAEYADTGRAPHWRDLNAVSAPVVLYHDSLHSVWANKAALDLAGIDESTPDPHGGHIVRDDEGQPTGILLESAGALVTTLQPEASQDERLDALADAMSYLNGQGVTSITDPVVWPELLRDYLELRKQGRASVRVSALLHWDWPSTSSARDRTISAIDGFGASTGLGDSWVRVGGIKLFADGIPSAGTACMHHPYPDGSTGDLVVEGDTSDERREALTDMVVHAHRKRLNVQVHVTGDKAADLAIDAIVDAQRAEPWDDARHALIHATLLSDSAPERLAQNGISVVTQSLFKYYNGVSMLPVIGRDRWNQTFPVRKLIDAGVTVADSTDAPCVEPDWRSGMLTFTGRADTELARLDGTQSLTGEEALAAWITPGAYLENNEACKGVIAPGYLADVAVVDVDPVEATADQLRTLDVSLTVVDGVIVHNEGE